MDKNTTIGFILIAIILIGFSWLNKPSEEQLAARKRYNDSIALVNQAKEQGMKKIEEEQTAATPEQKVTTTENDPFAAILNGEEEFVTLENDLLKLTFSNKGGFVYSAQLKEFKTHDSLPLILFDGKDENHFNLAFLTSNNRILNTGELYFKPFVTKTDSTDNLTMRLTIDSASYIDFNYTLPKDNYMMDIAIVPHNMQQILDSRNQGVELTWTGKIRQQEKSRKFEGRYTTLN
ncbi:MAG TPA: YidC/Oxa1 family insertase periplasmic-domain containing protein, partial [Paludibacteraceae bacterium]|nr:YidC/Oxa1 family insertase periplasmic-domain containing protein [Paludibacteraceae bacterium]